MLSGRRAFQRPTRAETLAAIIREEPEPLAALCPRIPVPLLWIVERCMAKLPDERYAATRDLARDLQSVRDHFSQIDSGAEGAPLLVSAGPRHSRAWLSAGVAAAFAALVASAYLLGTGAADRALPSFHRLTFRDGTIWSARFAPDARTIVYGAAWNGAPIRIFSTRPEAPESAALALPPATVLAVSPAGEMAISLGARAVGPFTTSGTLARASLSGGAPREVLESVQGADFAPDGASLAVVRVVDGRNRIEFPIGKPIYETGAGFLSHARVSPRGEFVAFIEHPMRGDDAGAVAVVDREGHKRVLSSGWITARGLAWSPDGGEVWFTAASAGGSRALHAVSLAGHRRLVTRVPGALTLHDVSHDGRVLLAEEHSRQGIVGLSPGESQERDLSWHDWSRPVDLTPDGTTLLFDETGEGGGAGYAVYVRKTDDAPAVRLGDGHALALSPDGSGRSRRPRPSRPSSCCCPPGRAERAGSRREASPTSCGRRGFRAASTSCSRPTSRAAPRGSTSSRSRAERRGPSRRRASGPTGPWSPTARAVVATGPGPPPAGLRHRRGCAGARAGPGRARGRRPDPLLARRARAVRPGPGGWSGVGDRTHRRVDAASARPGARSAPPAPSARSASRASSSRPTGSRTSTRTCGCSTSSSSSTG